MAHDALRKRLAAVAAAAVSDDVFEQITRSLQAAGDDGVKIPLTVRYVFSSDKDGVLEVSCEAKCNLALFKHSIPLSYSHGQIELAFEGAPVASAEEHATPAPRGSSQSPKPKPGGATFQADRVKQIQQNAEQMYRKGLVSRELAIAAGVDVDAIDGSAEQGAPKDQLSREELKALETRMG